MRLAVVSEFSYSLLVNRLQESAVYRGYNLNDNGPFNEKFARTKISLMRKCELERWQQEIAK